MSSPIKTARLALRMIRGGYVSARKISNLLRCCLHALTGDALSTGFPPVHAVDPSASCNLRCLVCPAGNADPDPRLRMAMEDYTRFTDEVSHAAIAFFLYVIGEPFMNRRLADMVRYAHAKRIYTVVSTNGHFIRSVDYAKELVSSGLDDLIFSISGLTQETCARYHRGGSIEKVKQGIRNLARAKKELGAGNPWVTVRYIEFDYNAQERSPAERYFRALGADAFEWRRGRTRYDTASMPDQSPDRMGQYRARFLPKSQPRAKRRGQCLWPWFISVVNWDGSLAVCTQYPWIEKETDSNCLGNVFGEERFKKVWQGPRARDFRRRAHSGNGLPPFCRGCTRGVGFGDET